MNDAAKPYMYNFVHLLSANVKEATIANAVTKSKRNFIFLYISLFTKIRSKYLALRVIS